MIKNIKSDKTKTSDGLTKLFLLFAFYQLILHTYFALASNDPQLFMPTSIAFFHDLAMLGITTAIGYLAIRVSPARFRKSIDKSFSIILIILGIILAAYPKILREYLVFPVNIFDSDISTTETLISDYLGINALLPSIIALILGIGVFVIKKEIRVSNKIKIPALIVILIIVGFTQKKTSPQPYVYSIRKKIESIIKNEKRVVPSLAMSIPESKIVDKEDMLTYSSKDITNYNHILLIVMEGVTSEVFEKEFMTIQDGFYEQYKSQSAYYQNYYASNLDSYTSLISTLTSVHVPYRAYADYTLYENVNTAPNITLDFHNKGFHNIFISTYEYQPFVPTRLYWDKIYERKDLPSIDEWVSLGSNKMESATEDKAAISTIVDNMKSNNKTFILHELVYGHSPYWRAKMQKSQSTYYNEYLMELSNILNEEKLFDKTLFIIGSDHGDRANSANMENYRIPLLIVGNEVSSQVKDEFLTHPEIPLIIYHYAASDKHPISCDEIFFVGSSEKWIYGKMNKEKEYLFIDNTSGTILSSSGKLNAIEVRNEFQDQLDMFNVMYGKK